MRTAWLWCLLLLLSEGCSTSGTGLATCTPDCEGKICGNDGCGVPCGSCPEGWTCEDYQCVCVPNCDGRECGVDGCGGLCGECAPLELCTAESVCLTELEGVPHWIDTELKIVTLDVGDGGKPGHALDVDGNAMTCAPLGKCQDGRDNLLSGVLDQMEAWVDVSDELAAGLEDGEIVLLASLTGWNPFTGTFRMEMFTGTPVLDREACDWLTEVCEYQVDPESLDYTTGGAKMVLDEARLVDGWLVAGGPSLANELQLPDNWLLESVSPTTPMVGKMAQVIGSLLMDGDIVIGLEEAIMGFAISRTALEQWVEEMSVDLPVSDELIHGTDLLFVPDIDTDLDGADDALSIGLRHSAIPAVLLGLPTCVPDCDGRECGHDGCNWVCGSCPSQYDLCFDGACQDCVPDCDGRDCGDDGYGGTCGPCL